MSNEPEKESVFFNRTMLTIPQIDCFLFQATSSVLIFEFSMFFKSISALAQQNKFACPATWVVFCGCYLPLLYHIGVLSFPALFLLVTQLTATSRYQWLCTFKKPNICQYIFTDFSNVQDVGLNWNFPSLLKALSDWNFRNTGNFIHCMYVCFCVPIQHSLPPPCTDSWQPSSLSSFILFCPPTLPFSTTL